MNRISSRTTGRAAAATFGRLLPRTAQIIAGGVAFLLLVSMPAAGFETLETELQLDTLFAPLQPGGPRIEAHFDAMLAADMNNDGRKELIIPGSDGRLRLLRLSDRLRRLELATWALVNTRVEGDLVRTNIYLTTAHLDPGGTESLLVALPRGIFEVRVEGDPPEPRFYTVFDRTFIGDSRRDRARIERLDFAADLDGDGRSELWIPEQEGMAFWRRNEKDGTWQEVGLPPASPRVSQTAGAVPIDTSSVQPDLYSLRFRHRLDYPDFHLFDLDRDKRVEILLLSDDHQSGPPVRIAEVYEMGNPLQYTTAPVQIRRAPIGQGNQTFLDLNGDGFLDMLEVSSNVDMVKPRTVILVYISPPVREYQFSRHTYRYTAPDPIGMVLHGEWNGDDLADLAYTQFEYTFGSTNDLVEMLLGREVGVTLRFVYGEDGKYGRPVQDLRFDIRNRSFNYRYFPPFSMEGDFDGDKRSDLLIRPRPERIQLHLSDGRGGQLNPREAVSIDVAETAYCFIEDLDGDGRSDLIVCDPGAPAIRAFLSRP